MDNRELLLQSALDLFYAKGFDAVSVQEIVERAGVTKPTLYYYFGSKLGLLQHLLEAGYQQLEDSMLETVREGESLSVVLYQVARVFFDYTSAHPKFYLFMLSLFYSGRENDAYQLVAPLIGRFYRIIVQIFEDAASQLGNMRGRQELFASGFTGVLDHHIMLVSYGHSEDEKLEITDETTYEIVRQFMYGIYN